MRHVVLLVRLLHIATALAAEALQVATALDLALKHVHVVLLMLLLQIATALAAEALQQAEAQAALLLPGPEPDAQLLAASCAVRHVARPWSEGLLRATQRPSV